MASPMREEKYYRLALTLVPGIGHIWFKKLLSYFGNAKEVFEAAHKGHPILSRSLTQRITATNHFAQAEKILKLHEIAGIQFMTTGDENYPKRLLELPDRPPILYYKGNSLFNQQRVVSIVGTRQLTAYGTISLTHLLEQLRPYQPLIVSGLAFGTDIAAHKQALMLGLSTVAVLPRSLNNIYPSAHKNIATDISMCGGILTEYPIGSSMGPYSFVARNRIIAGLADVTIVVEAKEKSGALITAYYANSYHREVFALPGSIYAATSAGCHQLIKRHQANLLTHINDLVYIMNWNICASDPPKKDIYATYPLTSVEQKIVQYLQNNATPIGMDRLVTDIALPLAELHAAFASLELQGLVNISPNQWITLTHKDQNKKFKPTI